MILHEYRIEYQQKGKADWRLWGRTVNLSQAYDYYNEIFTKETTEHVRMVEVKHTLVKQA